jgi:G:T/U-mismatch repair DNA glycosylase
MRVFAREAACNSTFDARLERVLKHGIGIWDVLAACHRADSLDSAIRNAKPNDCDSLQRACAVADERRAME